MPPPAVIDGARVLWWAWSTDPPFFVMHDTDGRPVADVCALAIARYDSGSVYRFSCNRDWETMNDSAYDCEDSARSAFSAQYDVGLVVWSRGAR